MFGKTVGVRLGSRSQVRVRSEVTWAIVALIMALPWGFHHGFRRELSLSKAAQRELSLGYMGVSFHGTAL
jgi:hypothetical protein